MRQSPLLLFVLCCTLLAQAQTKIVPYGAVWKYLDNGSNPGDAWPNPLFDDAVWKAGAAELGYGDGDEATVVDEGENDNRHVTTYFRKTITISDPGQFSEFKGKIKRDDGAVVYVNGTEVFRTNMPSGTITYKTLAARGASNDDGKIGHSFSIDAIHFTTGTNVVAVEVHQSSVGSSDVSFDFELVGTLGTSPAPDQTPPTVQNIRRKSPAVETTNATSVVFLVTFSEAVSGVNESDFTLSRTGSVTGSISDISGSGTSYDVTVSSIAGAGTLRLDLKSSGTGIEDDADNDILEGFTGGEQYKIEPSATDETPPTVVSINRQSPSEPTTSASSVVFRVTFSEAVSGVNAGDFTLTESGSAEGSIASMNGSGSTYDITVSSIGGEGTIRLDLKSSGTGIADAAGNAISGGYTSGQTYTISEANNPQPSTTLTRGPYLQAGSQTAVTLRWRTNVATNSKIDVGTTYGSYTHSATNATVTTEHEVRINGLQAGKKYYYRFGSSSQVLQSGTDNYFYTAPADNAADKVRVAVFGDCGKANSVQRNVLNAYLNFAGNNPAALMLLLGDNAYEDGTDADYQKGFFAGYGPTILKNHVLFPNPGNHDYHTTSKAARTAPYYKIFTMPTDGESGGVSSGTESFYSFDWGNIHFLSLDSYGEEAGGSRLYDTLGPQVQWVKRDLAANNKKWTVAFWHHPPYTMGSHNSDGPNDLARIRRNFIRILERNGVDLILGGHSHIYERSYLLKDYFGLEADFDRNDHTVSTSSGKYNGSSNSCPYVTADGKVNHGTVYVVSGSAARTGSEVHNSFPHDAMPFATRDGGMFYFEVEDNRLDAKFINQDGEVYDQFTILKEVNKNTTLNVSHGDQVTLTASWIGEYEWSNGANTRSITVEPTSNRTYTVTDGNNCLRDEFVIRVITTANDVITMVDPATSNNAPNELEVYPTRVRKGQSVFVKTNSDELKEASLVDNFGRQLRRFRLTGTTSVETTNLASGTYYIVIKIRDAVSRQKFVVVD